MIYDAAIIGTGPAGVSAALTLAANNKNFLLIGSAALSDKVNRAEHIANYPGLPGVTGKEMNDVFRRQLEEAHIQLSGSPSSTTPISSSGSATYCRAIS